LSKKIFSLIFGGSVRIAPKTKFLPSAAFSKLQDAEEVLQEVKKDVEKYKLQVAGECEKLKEQAQKEGFEAGFKQWAEQLVALENEMIRVRQDFEKVVVPVALKAAKKIVGREIELSPPTIVDIVSNSLKAVAQHKRITIYVNKKDLEILETHRTRLKQIFESLEGLSLRERSDVAQGGCVIETEGGIINARLENQWKVLESAFEALMKQKGPTPGS